MPRPKVCSPGIKSWSETLDWSNGSAFERLWMDFNEILLWITSSQQSLMISLLYGMSGLVIGVHSSSHFLEWLAHNASFKSPRSVECEYTWQISCSRPSELQPELPLVALGSDTWQWSHRKAVIFTLPNNMYGQAVCAGISGTPRIICDQCLVLHHIIVDHKAKNRIKNKRAVSVIKSATDILSFWVNGQTFARSAIIESVKLLGFGNKNGISLYFVKYCRYLVRKVFYYSSNKVPVLVHTGSCRQTIKIMDMSQDCLRTGDKALVRCRFIKLPEYLRTGQRMVLREGRTKAVGNITKIFPDAPGGNYDVHPFQPQRSSNPPHSAASKSQVQTGNAAGTVGGPSRRVRGNNRRHFPE